MSDLQHLAFMDLRSVSFPRHQRPFGNEEFDFREPDARGMPRMKHTLDECNMETWELYELRQYGLDSLDEFAALIVPLYTKKEVANMSADYFWRDLMSVIPKEAHYKAEVVGFLVQDCFQLSEDDYKVCLDKAEKAAMTEWIELNYSVEQDDMESVFSCARNTFLIHAPDTIPDVILGRYSLNSANNIIIDIMRST
jgi:hypothetical protein